VSETVHRLGVHTERKIDKRRKKNANKEINVGNQKVRKESHDGRSIAIFSLLPLL
jgi:hypothetical protein